MNNCTNDMIKELLKRVDKYLKKKGITSDYAASGLMCGNQTVIARMRNGKDIYTGTYHAIDTYLKREGF